MSFHVEAHRPANSENDDFTFAYSTSGPDGTYTDMVTVAKSSDDDSLQTYLLPAETSGSVHVRVVDTDRTPGSRVLDDLLIDRMFFLSKAPGSGPTDEEAWDAEYPGADLSDMTADFDRDGLSNREEYLWGLDPTRADSSNAIVAVPDPVTGTFRYTRRETGRTGATYSVWTSIDLAGWTEDTAAVQSVSSVAGAVETVEVTPTAPAGNGRLFMRVEATE